MQLPRRLAVILEGEGLANDANDATALILYRFAIAAVSTGSFSFGRAAGMFAAILAGEFLWGIGVGWVMLRLRRWVGDTRIEITLSILTPFLAYWPPQYLGGSGVLATVTVGLYISWNGLRLISAATRLQGVFVLGVPGLPDRRHGVPYHRPAGSNVDCRHPRLLGLRLGDLRHRRQRRGDHRALRLDVSRDLSSALAHSCDQTQGSLAAMAVADCAGLHRRPRHRFARLLLDAWRSRPRLSGSASWRVSASFRTISSGRTARISANG